MSSATNAKKASSVAATVSTGADECASCERPLVAVQHIGSCKHPMCRRCLKEQEWKKCPLCGKRRAFAVAFRVAGLERKKKDEASAPPKKTGGRKRKAPASRATSRSSNAISRSPSRTPLQSDEEDEEYGRGRSVSRSPSAAPSTSSRRADGSMDVSRYNLRSRSASRRPSVAPSTTSRIAEEFVDVNRSDMRTRAASRRPSVAPALYSDEVEDNEHRDMQARGDSRRIPGRPMSIAVPVNYGYYEDNIARRRRAPSQRPSVSSTQHVIDDEDEEPRNIRGRAMTYAPVIYGNDEGNADRRYRAASRRPSIALNSYDDEDYGHRNEQGRPMSYAAPPARVPHPSYSSYGAASGNADYGRRYEEDMELENNFDYIQRGQENGRRATRRPAVQEVEYDDREDHWDYNRRGGQRQYPGYDEELEQENLANDRRAMVTRAASRRPSPVGYNDHHQQHSIHTNEPGPSRRPSLAPTVRRHINDNQEGNDAAAYMVARNARAPSQRPPQQLFFNNRRDRALSRPPPSIPTYDEIRARYPERFISFAEFMRCQEELLLGKELEAALDRHRMATNRFQTMSKRCMEIDWRRTDRADQIETREEVEEKVRDDHEKTRALIEALNQDTKSKTGLYQFLAPTVARMTEPEEHQQGYRYDVINLDD